jgi:hypothetical protein
LHDKSMMSFRFYGGMQHSEVYSGKRRGEDIGA